MITRTNAVKMSVRKWEKVIKELVHGDSKTINGKCGFCVFYYNYSRQSVCPNCPLNPDVCKNNHDPESLYWKITDKIDRQDYIKALELSFEMLKQIKVRGEIWIKAGKK